MSGTRHKASLRRIRSFKSARSSSAPTTLRPSGRNRRTSNLIPAQHSGRGVVRRATGHVQWRCVHGARFTLLWWRKDQFLAARAAGPDTRSDQPEMVPPAAQISATFLSARPFPDTPRRACGCAGRGCSRTPTNSTTTGTFCGICVLGAPASHAVSQSAASCGEHSIDAASGWRHVNVQRRHPAAPLAAID